MYLSRGEVAKSLAVFKVCLPLVPLGDRGSRLVVLAYVHKLSQLSGDLKLSEEVRCVTMWIVDWCFHLL